VPEVRVGVDIGGTFTDLVLYAPRTGDVRFHKVRTTALTPSRGVLQGISELLTASRYSAGDVVAVVHGTTLATNALIERKGAETALLTTAGFEDVLAIGRERRYDIYDLQIEMPRPLVSRRRVAGIRERSLASGAISQALDEEAAQRTITTFADAGVSSFAVCLLHSYRNPSHERRLAELIRESAPRASISLSSEVMPEIREYERTVTTLANAFLQPLMATYLGALEDGLTDIGIHAPLFLMLSDGGIAARPLAAAFPVRLVESGPAGGALASSAHARLSGSDLALSFDMGGTTAKMVIIRGGEPSLTTEFEAAREYRFKRGSGLPLKVPTVDLVEIGAGGGSIAGLDDLGLLRVGPESSGSEPGPICYGLGGSRPTVTDADLVLGYLNPDYFLGGGMRLDVDGARAGLAHHLAAPLGVDVTDAAWAVHQHVNASMVASARVHAAEVGVDLFGATMIALGGAGPVHAVEVAKGLGVRSVIFPAGAGVASAIGFLTAPIRFETARSLISDLDALPIEEINTMLETMERSSRAYVRDAGVEEAEIRISRSCAARYVGQGYEIVIPLPDGPLTSESASVLLKSFHDRHRTLYGHANDVSVEAISWRVVVAGPPPDATALLSPTLPARTSPVAARDVYFPGRGYGMTPVFDRYALPVGFEGDGPAIIEERESTIVIGEATRFHVTPSGTVVAQILSGAGQREPLGADAFAADTLHAMSAQSA
jgi:N-methylhydantoinase A